MRDKLIELIGSAVCDCYSPSCEDRRLLSCEACYVNGHRIGDVADHLIANGVTVGDANNATTTWRPASEPPKEEGMYLCINEDGNYFEAYYSQIYEEFGIESAIYDHQTLGFLDTEWQGYSVTHWMPLPKAPKGE